MQGAARTALHKEHAEIGNDVTMRKKGRINEEKKRKGTKRKKRICSTDGRPIQGRR